MMAEYASGRNTALQVAIGLYYLSLRMLFIRE